MALASSCQGFIFDFGGVLVHHQSDADQTRLAKLAGIPNDLFTELYWRNRLNYDKGELSATEYWQDVAARSGATLRSSLVEQLTGLDSESWMQFDPVMWDWIDRLRARGKRVAMLSNMPRDLGEALRSRTQRLNSFDHVTLSYEVHAVKPEPVIYEHCLEGLGTPPEQTLFLDDRIENIQGAELFGMRGVQFTNREDVLSLLGA